MLLSVHLGNVYDDGGIVRSLGLTVERKVSSNRREVLRSGGGGGVTSQQLRGLK